MSAPQVLLLVCIFAGAALSQPVPREVVSRVAEEAEVLRQNAPKVLTQETLEQHAVMPPSRFHPRIGSSADEVPKPRIAVREVVSEYSVGALKDSENGNLVEFRQVVSVDGRTIQSTDNARRALSLGVHSADDRLRKRMLENFAKHGLVDVATDYALLLLAFSKRGIEQMDLQVGGEAQVGVDTATVIRWQQKSSEGGELEFHGRQVAHRALQGDLWVRKSDGLPLRISAWAEHSDARHQIRDEGTVDYVMSPHGFLTPASVVHRHIVDGSAVTENLYRYQPFKLFSAESGISFTAEPDPTPPIAPKK
ncbi:MAG TPA: hypothetical protein VKU19_00375 [Bryobacteraceae bacterium]|nr:hypothetical protein [Bryobacteraceae bacterium]